MQRRPGIRWLALVGLVTLVIGAVPVGATTSPGTFNPADAALVPAVDRGVTLQVATDATYPPDEWMSGPKMVGFDVDVMAAVAKTLGLKIKENNIPFDAIIPGISSNKYQIGNSSFTDTKALEKSVNFVDYFRAGEGVFSLASSNATFKSLANLCGLNVAVVANSVEQTSLGAEVAECPSNAPLTVHTCSSQTKAYLAVLAGADNVGFVDSQVAGYYVMKAKGALKLVGGVIDAVPYGLATAKSANGRALARALRAGLVTLMANGSYQRIVAKWGVGSGALPARAVVVNGASS